MEVGKKYFEQLIDKMKAEKGVQYDIDLTAADLKTLAEQFKAEYKKQLGEDFPSDPVQQLKLAIEAVFRSWEPPCKRIPPRQRYPVQLGYRSKRNADGIRQPEQRVRYRRCVHT